MKEWQPLIAEDIMRVVIHVDSRGWASAFYYTFPAGDTKYVELPLDSPQGNIQALEMWLKQYSYINITQAYNAQRYIYADYIRWKSERHQLC